MFHTFLATQLLINFSRIFSVEKLSNNLLQESITLQYTPRSFIRHPEQPLFYVIESDNNVLAPATRTRLLNDAPTNGHTPVLPAEQFGYPRGRSHWASSIQIVDPITTKSVLATLDLEDNEAAVSIAAVPFASQDDEAFLLVGTGKDMVTSPRSFSCGFIHVYRFHADGKELELIHKTQVEQPPLALLAFQGRLLAGVGPELYIYDLGMRQLLRKTKSQCAPTLITGLQTQGSRIIVSDVGQSVTYVVYKFAENKLIPFADDTVARWTTATAMVDYETVAGGDKFGNVWFVRCTKKASDEADEEGAAHLLHERQFLHGTPSRLDLMIHFYTQDIPMSIQKTALVAGGRELLLWAGIQGTIGIFIPFVSREDVDFFQQLESQLRTEDPPLAGRDHLIYRSYYAPVKCVIDGDLCERFMQLPNDKKQMIAGDMDRTVREVERKIQEARTKVAF